MNVWPLYSLSIQQTSEGGVLRADPNMKNHLKLTDAHSEEENLDYVTLRYPRAWFKMV